MNVFNINTDDNCFDETFTEQINDRISQLYKIINGIKFLEACIKQISEKYFTSSDLEFGFVVLFSFDYLHLVHPCISEFIETGKINENNQSLIDLKNMLF